MAGLGPVTDAANSASDVAHAIGLSDARKALGLAPITLGNVLSGNIVKNKKDPERVKAAEDALNRALAGDQAAYQYMVQQSQNSATDVGKKAFQQALQLYSQHQGSPSGGLGGSATGAPGTANASSGLLDQAGDFLRQLNGGKALTLGNLAGGAVKNLGDAASSAGSFLTGNNGLNALGLAQGINAAMLGQQSNEYAKQALGTATSSYNERAPLRAAGQAGLLAPKTQDLSELTAIRRAPLPSAPQAPGGALGAGLSPQRPTPLRRTIATGNPYAAPMASALGRA